MKDLWVEKYRPRVLDDVVGNTEALSREFDERLEAKVQALLEEYGSADALLHCLAVSVSAKAKKDT